MSPFREGVEIKRARAHTRGYAIRARTPGHSTKIQIIYNSPLYFKEEYPEGGDDMNPFQTPLAIMQRNFEAALPAMTAKAGAIIVEHSMEAFDHQGWTDNTLEPWTARKSDDTKSKGRSILVLTGRLRRSIRVVSTSADSVTVGSETPYAQIHNEGGTINHGSRSGILNFDRTPEHSLWRFGKANTIKQQRGIKAIRRVTYKAHSSQMPKRQFLGNSHQQTTKIKAMMLKELFKAFKVLPGNP